MEVSAKNKQPAQGVHHSSPSSSHWLVCSLLIHGTCFLLSHLDCLCCYLPTFLFCLLSSPSSCLDPYYLSKTRSSHSFCQYCFQAQGSRASIRDPIVGSAFLKKCQSTLAVVLGGGDQLWKAMLYVWRIRTHQDLCFPWSSFSPSRSSLTLLYP